MYTYFLNGRSYIFENVHLLLLVTLHTLNLKHPFALGVKNWRLRFLYRTGRNRDRAC